MANQKQATRARPPLNGSGSSRKAPKGTGALRRAEARRRARRNRILVVAVPTALVLTVALVAVLSSLGGGSPTKSPSGAVTVQGAARSTLIPVGEKIPSFSAPALAPAGTRVSWASYRGKPTVLSLWAPWCPHCQKELPVLDGLVKAAPGVRLVSIVTAVGQKPGPTPQEFMDQRNLTFPVAMDAKDGRLGQAMGLTEFPTTYFVDRTGVVRDVVVGERTPEQTRASLAKITG